MPLGVLSMRQDRTLELRNTSATVWRRMRNMIIMSSFRGVGDSGYPIPAAICLFKLFLLVLMEVVSAPVVYRSLVADA